MTVCDSPGATSLAVGSVEQIPTAQLKQMLQETDLETNCLEKP